MTIRVRCVDTIGTNGYLVVGQEYDAMTCKCGSMTCKCGSMTCKYDINGIRWNSNRFVVVNGSEEIVKEEP